jgi:hypothetical protein
MSEQDDDQWIDDDYGSIQPWSPERVPYDNLHEEGRAQAAWLQVHPDQAPPWEDDAPPAPRPSHVAAPLLPVAPTAAPPTPVRMVVPPEPPPEVPAPPILDPADYEIPSLAQLAFDSGSPRPARMPSSLRGSIWVK